MTTYGWVAEAAPGDHIAVRCVTNGKPDAIWHHGLYVGDNKLIHMHPEANISEVGIDNFMRALPQANTYIDKVVVVEYSGDSPFAKQVAVKVAMWALRDDSMRKLTCNIIGANCECFAAFCRTGRLEVDSVSEIMSSVSAPCMYMPVQGKRSHL